MYMRGIFGYCCTYIYIIVMMLIFTYMAHLKYWSASFYFLYNCIKYFYLSDLVSTINRDDDRAEGDLDL